MDNILNVINENGIEETVEVLEFYQLEEYDHEYVLYTKNEEVGDNIITYISIIEEVGPEEYRFIAITNEEEERKLNDLINKDIEETMNM